MRVPLNLITSEFLKTGPGFEIRFRNQVKNGTSIPSVSRDPDSGFRFGFQLSSTPDSRFRFGFQLSPIPDPRFHFGFQLSPIPDSALRFQLHLLFTLFGTLAFCNTQLLVFQRYQWKAKHLSKHHFQANQNTSFVWKEAFLLEENSLLMKKKDSTMF